MASIPTLHSKVKPNDDLIIDDDYP